MQLEKIFVRALEYEIYLNPKKCNFTVTKSNFLENIISKDRVSINTERVVSIDINQFIK